ncbi:hypothetical protein MNQ98_21390 [Paenibacillus sp. N3/727]|uniref:hypothetical protein n=1 Tax=Paenibacillus sp. N3/727 TaxID=2925845 RepID=UPI001F52E787|nr:hypothetical protein [Paenibacillus sp. N3/727]UNK17020.1 hypothetical protein MNQ98_21390 [Paenibacillus sp. N3/727]
MSPLSLIGLLGLISAIIQIKYPELILKLRPLGVRSVEAVKLGGYLGLVISPLIILFDILY